MSEQVVSGSRNGIQVIARAAAILRVLKGAQTGMSLGQIAEQVGLPRSTVQRIVGALQAERLVIASGAGGVRLGPELHALAESTRYNIVDTVRPLLVELSRATEETVDLSICRGANMIFLDQIPGTQRLRAVSGIGDAFPLTVTANGKACLAAMDDKAIEKLARDEWARTGQTGSLEALKAEIAEIRQSGIAYDLDEHTEGISACGIAFSDWKGDLYAISIPVPSTRFRKNRKRLSAAIDKIRFQIASVVRD